LARAERPGEVERFRKALADESPADRAALELLALTGMRRGELLGLRKRDINFAERVITLPPPG
jgi:integrase